MKKIYFLLLLLLAGNVAFAQDYLPLPQVGMRRYFTNAAGYLRGIRVDSVVQEVGHKRYVTFRTPRGWKSFSELAYSNGACWVGKDVRAYANGDWHFPNHAGDTVLIKTGAQVGDTWAFYTDTTNRWFEAKVIAIDTQTVFGTLDSVKIVELTAKIGNTPLPADPITGFQIVLSKTHGFAEVPDLYLFPYVEINLNSPPRDYWYEKVTGNTSFSQLVFRDLPEWSVDMRQLFTAQAGDVFLRSHRASDCGGGITYSKEYSLDTVLSRQDFANSTTYVFNRWKWIIGYNGNLTGISHATVTTQIFSASAFDTLLMPEEFASSYTTTYVFPNDTGYCIKGLLVRQIAHDGRGLQVRGEIRSTSSTFKAGLGEVYGRYYAHTEGDCYYDRLEFFLKNGISCGTLQGVPSAIKGLRTYAGEFILYPQPATTEVFLEAPQLRYPATVSIQNLQGQLLSRQILSSAGKPVFVGDLPAGMYLFSVTDAGGNSAVQKLLVGNH